MRKSKREMRNGVVFLGLIVLLLPSTALAGALEVSVSPINHETIPKGAERVPVLELRLENTCATPIQIYAFNVRREGQGSSSDIERIYLMEGIRRISRGVGLRSGGTATLRPRRMSLAPGEVRTVTIAADFSASAATAGIHRFILEAIEMSKGVERRTSLPEAKPLMQSSNLSARRPPEVRPHLPRFRLALRGSTSRWVNQGFPSF